MAQQDAVPQLDRWVSILASDTEDRPNPEILDILDHLRPRWVALAQSEYPSLSAFHRDFAIATAMSKFVAAAAEGNVAPPDLAGLSDEIALQSLARYRDRRRGNGHDQRLKKDEAREAEAWVEVLRSWSVRNGWSEPAPAEELRRWLTRCARTEFPAVSTAGREDAVQEILQRFLRPSLTAGLTPLILRARMKMFLCWALNGIREKECDTALFDATELPTPGIALGGLDRKREEQIEEAFTEPADHLRDRARSERPWREIAERWGITQVRARQEWRRVQGAARRVINHLQTFGKIAKRDVERILKNEHVPVPIRDAILERVLDLARGWKQLVTALLAYLPIALRERIRRWLNSRNSGTPSDSGSQGMSV